MSYNPVTDFLGLLRQTSNGVQQARMPGLDFIVTALARANMFRVYVGQTAPTVNQSTTLWLKTAVPSWTAEGAVFLWDATAQAYAPATPQLWSDLLSEALFNPTPNMIFDTIGNAQSTAIDPSITSLLIVRYATGYECAPAVYVAGTAVGPNAFQDAKGKWWQLDLTPDVHYASWYGVNGDGGDYHAQLQTAITWAAGREVRLPAGTIGLGQSVGYTTPINGGQALRLSGVSPGFTTIDNRCAGGTACINAHGAPNIFAYNGFLKNIKFTTSTRSTVAHLDLLAVYRFVVEDCEFNDGQGNGVTITNNVGDSDASNIVLFKRCLFQNNSAGGLVHNFAHGIVQTSFVRCEDCLFTENGLTGWYFVGAQGSMVNCGFTENGYGTGGQGGLWIANNGSSNSQFTAISCSFENNYNNSARLDALQGGDFINCEIAGGTSTIISTIGFSINGSSKISFRSTRVRIGSTLNPYTAWDALSGTSDCVIANTFWQNFDAAGQTRFAQDGTSYGNRFDDSFNAVQEGADNGVTFITCATGANEDVAIPSTGVIFAIGGVGGAFSIGGFTGGSPGRQLTIINTTGSVMTLNHEDASSQPNNRLWLGGGPLSVAYQKGVTLRYYSQQNRWVLT